MAFYHHAAGATVHHSLAQNEEDRKTFSTKGKENLEKAMGKKGQDGPDANLGER